MSIRSLRDLPTPRTIVARCILVVVTIRGFRPSDLFKGYSCRCSFIGPRKKVTVLGFGQSDLRTMVTASGFRPSKFSLVGSWSSPHPKVLACRVQIFNTEILSRSPGLSPPGAWLPWPWPRPGSQPQARLPRGLAPLLLARKPKTSKTRLCPGARPHPSGFGY